VCVIGAGALSSRRIYPNLGAAGLRLVGVCDLDRDKAERNAALFGGTPYVSVERMLAEQRPDGVVVCVGPDGHAALALQILRAGFPAYTEKPPAPTVDAAVEVARVARETGLLCMTAFKKRYSVAFEHARRWLDQFAEEDRLSISHDYCSAAYGDAAAGRSPFLFDFAIHHLDLTHYLMGDVDEVFAYARGTNTFAVSLRFASGAVGSMHLSDARSFAVPTEEVGLTVRGGNFLTVSNSSRWREVRDGTPSGWREPATFTSGGDSGRDTGHLAELEAFAAHLRDGTAVRSPIEESLKSLVLHDAILESAGAGRPVAVRYPRI
jgi:predicted dehydrogenase